VPLRASRRDMPVRSSRKLTYARWDSSGRAPPVRGERGRGAPLSRTLRCYSDFKNSIRSALSSFVSPSEKAAS